MLRHKHRKHHRYCRCIKSFLYKIDLIFYLLMYFFVFIGIKLTLILTLFIEGEVNIDSLRSRMLESQYSTFHKSFSITVQATLISLWLLVLVNFTGFFFGTFWGCYIYHSIFLMLVFLSPALKPELLNRVKRASSTGTL